MIKGKMIGLKFREVFLLQSTAGVGAFSVDFVAGNLPATNSEK